MITNKGIVNRAVSSAGRVLYCPSFVKVDQIYLLRRHELFLIQQVSKMWTSKNRNHK